MSIPIQYSLSRGVLTTILPPIPRAYQWAAKFNRSEDRPLLDMSQGVPGIPPPEILRDAIAEASRSPSSYGYTSYDGEKSLRKALAEEMRLTYGGNADIQMEDVALSAGCNLAFIAVALTLADAGGEIILPVPWYFNHQMDLNVLGIKTVPLLTLPEDGFLPSVEKCRALVTSKTKAITLVTPNNPTGAIYPPSLIASFMELASSAGIALILDETYRDFITTSAPHDQFASPSWRSTLIQVYSFSKSYCMPGHRLGAIVASPETLKSVKIVLDCLQICPPRPPQIALAGLLPTLRPFVKDMALAIEARHKLFKDNLPQGWTVGSQGGYFAFVKHPFEILDAETVCRQLAESAGVVSLPASFFTEEGDGETEETRKRWIRFSVANIDDEKVKKVCERLATFVPLQA